MISAIILAAGRASRMGRPKQLLEIGGVPLVRRVALSALGASVGEVLVVVGQAADEVTATLADLPLRIIPNPHYAEGMSTSLQAGVTALAPDSEAAVILLGDQPFVRPRVLDTLIQRYRDTGARVVIPVAAGRRGNPVLFDNYLYPELLGVTGDQGARAVVARHQGDIALVEIHDARLHLDVDTPADYAAVRALLEQEEADGDG